VQLCETPIALNSVEVEASNVALAAIEEFFRSKTTVARKVAPMLLSDRGFDKVKSLVKDWLPPALLRSLSQILKGGGIRFEGDYASWEEAVGQCAGYDEKHILEKVLDATLKVKRGEAAFERDSVLFDEVEYVWPVVAGLMWAAARSGGRLNVLDFGGALGSSYFQNRAFFNGLSEVRWNVVEQAHYVEAGKKHVEDERLHFYSTLDQCLAATQPNVVFFSSVLQYVSEPYEILRAIDQSTASLLLIDRTPFSATQSDTLMIQHVPASIYEASYPMWVFGREALMSGLVGWQIVDTHSCPEGTRYSRDGFPFTFEGMLLERLV